MFIVEQTTIQKRAYFIGNCYVRIYIQINNNKKHYTVCTIAALKDRAMMCVLVYFSLSLDPTFLG